MYRLTANTQTIYKIDEQLWIAVCENNPAYEAYLAWVEEGNEPEPWVEPVPIVEG